MLKFQVDRSKIDEVMSIWASIAPCRVLYLGGSCATRYCIFSTPNTFFDKRACSGPVMYIRGSNGPDKLTICELVEQRSKRRTTVKKKEFCVDKRKKMLSIILMEAFCSTDLASTTLSEYKKIIEFYFEFLKIQR